MSLLSVIVRMSLIGALAIIGNLCLVFVIRRGNARRRQRVSPVQVLLLHTCTADLLFALLCLGTQILILCTYPYFYGPDLVCRLVRYLQVLPLYASPFLLVAISIDRYQAICRPLVHYRSDRFRRPNCLGLTAWALALVCSAPQLFIWRKDPLGTYAVGGGGNGAAERNSTNIEECHTIYGNVDPDLWKCVYVVWFSTVAWLLPSLLSGIFYYRVCSTVWRSRFWGRPDQDEETEGDAEVARQRRHAPRPASQGALVAPQQPAGDAIASGGGGGCRGKLASRAASCQLTRDYVEGLRKSSTGFRNQISEFDRKRIQTVRLTLTIVICNFFLWLPFCAINVIQAFWGLKLLSSNVIVYIVILGNLNACVNPWIYILWNPRQTRRALATLMRAKGNGQNGFRQMAVGAFHHTATNTRQTSIGLQARGGGHKNNSAETANGNSASK